jgi:hypothetical protein
MHSQRTTTRSVERPRGITRILAGIGALALLGLAAAPAKAQTSDAEIRTVVAVVSIVDLFRLYDPACTSLSLFVTDDDAAAQATASAICVANASVSAVPTTPATVAVTGQPTRGPAAVSGGGFVGTTEASVSGSSKVVPPKNFFQGARSARLSQNRFSGVGGAVLFDRQTYTPFSRRRIQGWDTTTFQGAGVFTTPGTSGLPILSGADMVTAEVSELARALEFRLKMRTPRHAGALDGIPSAKGLLQGWRRMGLRELAGTVDLWSSTIK